MSALRVVFMGSPAFSVPALEAIIAAGHSVIGVYTQPPRPKGRGRQLAPSPVHAFAQERGLPVLTPKSLKTPEAQAEFAALKADVAVVVAYGLLLPKPVLDAPRYGCLNIHASLLPRWRGASPMQQAILVGDKETGVTIMQMDEGLDTGPMITARTISLNETTTLPALHNALSALGAEMIVETLAKLAKEKKLDSTPQDNTQSTYAPLLKKEDGQVDWSKSADEINRQIRALNPWPGVWCRQGDKRLKILEAAVLPGTAAALPGMILDRDGRVASGTGILKITKIQPENAKAMDFPAALNGGYIEVGAVLS